MVMRILLVSVGILKLVQNSMYILILEHQKQQENAKSLSISADSILPRLCLPTSSKTLDLHLY
eukprot:snap_masked-scaffold_23-processed-gene-2.43-mRNA-1 protein AED:1.00 eAED:1.00 QI:0/0/0/0/1/1/2/0/62